MCIWSSAKAANKSAIANGIVCIKALLYFLRISNVSCHLNKEDLWQSSIFVTERWEVQRH